MAIRIPAQVNPPLIVWAREDAGYSLTDAAERAGFTEEKLRAWEAGQAQPTLRQAERLAKIYQRPFSVFSLPEPPKLPPLATECRRLPGVRSGEEPPALRVAVREMVHRHQLALHLHDEMGDEPIEYPLRAHFSEEPEAVGQRLRAALEVPLTEQLGWSNEYAAFRVWRMAVERLGVLVCRFPGKEIADVRGTSIVHFPLPVVGINSKELPLSKAFTMLHEVVHLALVASNEERPAQSETRDEPSWLEAERFCEGAAGAALMPAAALLADVDVSSQRKANVWEITAMRCTARRFRVTPSAVATRLLRLGVMTPRAFASWSEAWQAHRDAHPGKPSFGIATPIERAVGRNGPMFTMLVLSALSHERISSADASNYLDLGFAHVEKLLRHWIDYPALQLAEAKT